MLMKLNAVVILVNEGNIFHSLGKENIFVIIHFTIFLVANISNIPQFYISFSDKVMYVHDINKTFQTSKFVAVDVQFQDPEDDVFKKNKCEEQIIV